jgi:hypothetical protein
MILIIVLLSLLLIIAVGVAIRVGIENAGLHASVVALGEQMSAAAQLRDHWKQVAKQHYADLLDQRRANVKLADRLLEPVMVIDGDDADGDPISVREADRRAMNARRKPADDLEPVNVDDASVVPAPRLDGE